MTSAPQSDSDTQLQGLLDQSLADRLTQGRVSEHEAITWVIAIAEALDHAHRSGVIYRDVKPANILIDAHGGALLADFGIARSSMKTGAFAPSLGTLRYMAPEQLAGQAAEPQSDTYSLAVVLYEALAEEPPSSASDPNAIRRMISTGLQMAWPARLPRHVMPVLSKAMSRNPRQRHASAGDFATDLRRQWTGSAPQFRWRPWVTIAQVAAIGAATAIASLRRQLPPAADSSLNVPATSRREPGDRHDGADALIDRRDEVTKQGLTIVQVHKSKKLFDEKKYSAAVVPLKEALQIDSDSPYLHHQIGACYFNMKDYEHALDAFDQAARLDPANTQYHLHRAYALSLLGRQDEAEKAFEAARHTADLKPPQHLSPWAVSVGCRTSRPT